MDKTIISSNNAPKATGPFSQAVLHSSKYNLELSGQIGINPESGSLTEGGITAETEQTLNNIEAVLSEVGWGFENIIKCRIYLAEMKNYAVVNELYAKKFPINPPSRIALAVKDLPLGALVEIECVAAGDEIKE
ncbi:Rid family detoxifying hydrolase [Candidatus Parcubacteria bacterium]|nr:Rid family detoxifying hydrolase [Candidatus Parcubacteria bacterium]